MTRTRIKFCGITRAEDARRAADLGVDAIGLVFTRRSSRFVTPEQARDIVIGLPPLLTVVALFMDNTDDWVREVERAVKPSLLQFHGSESDTFCQGFDTTWIKAIAMNSADDAATRLEAWPHARGYVLDGHRAGAPGGQGTAFDWARVPADMQRPLILAGGLDADNVATAIGRVRPWAVDVSSGIEVSPGIKHPDKMQAFVKAVHSTYEA